MATPHARPDATDEVHPVGDVTADGPDPLGPLAVLVGTWRGEGHGDFPTIDAFDYVEEVVFAPTGKPVLSYVQRTRTADGRPLHAESGYVRRVDAIPDDLDALVQVEWVIAQPTGLAETAMGTLRSGVLETSAIPHRTPTAVVVADVRRRYAVDGDTLSYDLWMATGDVPTSTHHLRAALERVRD